MDYIASAALIVMSVLCTWFLAPEEAPPKRSMRVSRQKEKGILLLLDLVFFLASLVPPQMPVIARWSLWFACWIITVILIQIQFDKPKSFDRRYCVTLVMGFLFIASLHSVIYGQWREEKAATLTGELCSFRSFWGTCYTPPMPIIEIADSGTKFIWGGQGPMQMGGFAHNVGLRIEQGKHGIELSTPLLDRSGRKIVNIEKNHWTVVPPPGIWDKNYTQNSLEVKDNREQVVLQIKFLPDRIQIAVEWRDQFGRGQEWSKCGSNKALPSCISPWGSPQTELQNEQIIEPIFQYPSNEHLGEFVDQ